MDLTVRTDTQMATVDMHAKRVVVEASDCGVTAEGWVELPVFATLVVVGVGVVELLKYSHDQRQATYVQEAVPHAKAWKLKVWNG